MTTTNVISNNLERINRQISSAKDRASRSTEEIQLIAVTKYAELDWVKALMDLDMYNLGESRPQQLAERSQALPDSIQWHMIGHLQRNKVRSVLESGAIIHSVDSVRLLERIESIAAELETSISIFLEVNISGEESKYGFSPESISQTVSKMSDYPHVQSLGLMTMAPYSDNPEDARPCFQQLRELQNDLNTQLDSHHQLNCLSMGMSGDFEVAIEEGATHVRIGSALFEGLSSD